MSALEDEDASFCRIDSWRGSAPTSKIVQCYHEDSAQYDLSFYIIVIE